MLWVDFKTPELHMEVVLSVYYKQVWKKKKQCTEVQVPATQAKTLNLLQNNSRGK